MLMLHRAACSIKMELRFVVFCGDLMTKWINNVSLCCVEFYAHEFVGQLDDTLRRDGK
jgi:hypothetical protein